MAGARFSFSAMRIPQMLAVMLATGWLAAACSSSKLAGTEAVAADLEKMRSAATKHVDDTQRRAGLLRSIDALQLDLDALRRVDFDTMTQIRALNTQPDISRAEMQATMEKLDQVRRQARERVVQHHFEMIALTTAGEWKELAGPERKALLAATQ